MCSNGTQFKTHINQILWKFKLNIQQQITHIKKNKIRVKLKHHLLFMQVSFLYNFIILSKDHSQILVDFPQSTLIEFVKGFTILCLLESVILQQYHQQTLLSENTLTDLWMQWRWLNQPIRRLNSKQSKNNSSPSLITLILVNLGLLCDFYNDDQEKICSTKNFTSWRNFKLAKIASILEEVFRDKYIDQTQIN
ncbi:unnamed protein product (macronuclear) [Paramecium tetraurelia]|uniref:Uncharacterized protein n=1 Tax=Paramecium tetraurelia TaxID=5888 RepID=A0BZ20_PARTE|nr:uncharacterized protein GSPATT00033640001 [Paramecium tetraurelia]CAK63787.1 unnamed protein product [Paramecium tetraurelia]|eukprot:XP_001431185.1 hypothetical protein (macronuclear) [Paramecium tetraurelia strain d4-2]